MRTTSNLWNEAAVHTNYHQTFTFYLFEIIGRAAAAVKLITETLHVYLALIKNCGCSFNNDLRFTQHHDPYE